MQHNYSPSLFAVKSQMAAARAIFNSKQLYILKNQDPIPLKGIALAKMRSIVNDLGATISAVILLIEYREKQAA